MLEKGHLVGKESEFFSQTTGKNKITKAHNKDKQHKLNIFSKSSQAIKMQDCPY